MTSVFWLYELSRNPFLSFGAQYSLPLVACGTEISYVPDSFLAINTISRVLRRKWVSDRLLLSSEVLLNSPAKRRWGGQPLAGPEPRQSGGEKTIAAM
jgi:hypothetical protein